MSTLPNRIKPGLPGHKWWVDSSGILLLRGVPGSEDNPPLLSDSDIIYYLTHIRQARLEFDRAFYGLTAEEQQRFITLFEEYPETLKLVQVEKDVEDSFQRGMNTGPIRTSGPNGGGAGY